MPLARPHIRLPHRWSSPAVSTANIVTEHINSILVKASRELTDIFRTLFQMQFIHCWVTSPHEAAIVWIVLRIVKPLQSPRSVRKDSLASSVCANAWHKPCALNTEITSWPIQFKSMEVFSNGHNTPHQDAQQSCAVDVWEHHLGSEES